MAAGQLMLIYGMVTMLVAVANHAALMRDDAQTMINAQDSWIA
jgi:hypothetical protein